MFDKARRVMRLICSRLEKVTSVLTLSLTDCELTMTAGLKSWRLTEKVYKFVWYLS